MRRGCITTARFFFFILWPVVYVYAPLSAHAAAWTQEAGHGQIIQSETFYTANVGSSAPGSAFYKFEYKPLIEYGFQDGLTLGVAPSFQLVSIDGTYRNSNVGLTDIDLYYRYRLYRDQANVVSIQPLIKLSGIYNEDAQPTFGENQIDAEIRVLWGRNFQWNERYHFTNLELAYRNRAEGLNEELRGDATLGYYLDDQWMVMSQLFSIFGLNKDNQASRLFTNSTDFDLVKAQFSLVKKVTPEASVQIGVFSHIYHENTGGGGGLVISVWKDF